MRLQANFGSKGDATTVTRQLFSNAMTTAQMHLEVEPPCKGHITVVTRQHPFPTDPNMGLVVPCCRKISPTQFALTPLYWQTSSEITQVT